MAGSYLHCVDDNGALRDNEALTWSLENGGDVYEAVEEMYGMIWVLAEHWAKSNDTDLPGLLGHDEVTTQLVVEWARQNYLTGLDLSPGD
jgi:hypothetical protein